MKSSHRAGPLVPRYGRWPLLAALASQCVIFWGTKLVTAGWYHYDMTTALDRAVPLLPWTVTVYVGAFVFWAANYILIVRQDERTCFRMLAADLLGKLVCLVCFLLLPAVIVRPAIPEGTFLGWALELVYALDTPDALFPSLHCFNSWLCWAGLRGRRNVPAWYRTFSLVFALAVAASTMTTKQHVLADVIAGLALGELSWQIAGRAGLDGRYRRLWQRRA